MPEGSPQGDQHTSETAQPSPSETPVATSQPGPVEAPTESVAFPDRTELLTRARTFLASPQVQLQDSDAKRAFLAEKGLAPSEVDQLLRESPPSVPPRTYPAPPPSNLPNLLVGVVRLFTWLTGASAFALFVYYRFLLPRLTRSYQARLALRKHQSALVARLAEFASALKATQAESYKDLPRTLPVYEDPRYSQCHTIDELLSHGESSREEPIQRGADISDVTILRCALEELGLSKTDGTSTEELFRHLEAKLPWLAREEGAARQSDLWNQLDTCPLFVSSLPKPDTASPLPLDHPSRLLWKYSPPLLPSTPPLLTSLENLQAALPRRQEAAPVGSGDPPPMSARQRTLQALADFTGYITTQTYSLSIPSIRGTSDVVSDVNPIEDELRREIRALKGLVLNRRTFLPPGARLSGSGGASDPPQSSEA